MAVDNASDDSLLSKPTENTQYESHERSNAIYNPLSTFTLPRSEAKHYQQQYADMYFTRLAQLKPAVESIASEAFSDFQIGGEQARKVDRVLDVRQGHLCWVIGTVYIEMPLKPNVLEDIGKEHWIAAPPARQKYNPGEGNVSMMLEDESGRLKLTGGFLASVLLVTGAIVAVLGTENSDGDFEVLDIRVPDLPRQPQRWERDDGDAALKGKKASQKRETGGKVAIVSGLSISGDDGDTLMLDVLAEYLLGEAAGLDEQAEVSQISRLIIAGNTLAHGQPIPSREEVAAAKKSGKRTYGYDASAYNANPTERLDSYMASLLPSIPITLLPGFTDPTSTALPQQPIHPAMFTRCRAYMAAPLAAETEPSWLDSTTNPAEFDLQGWRFLGAGGQTVEDVYKYVDGEERLEMMEAMLRWRLSAPTAPDTLWCFPFQDGDKFVIQECPHVYFAGCQPKFESSTIEGPHGQQVKLIAVPSFKETGQVVLMDLEDLSVEVVIFEAFEG
ncbi:DNA polymerase subunit delta-2 [Pseudocercospora fuligena]|uniref:DNA-directed DNA polymerase n=1 Tax=Pseudocercospora fuligena TaxID=685502 RepID=A0A8H6RGA3_9PEZI|nr:DNA polymerase subunit delta-2 [Pseudocercospora fuligena]